MVTQIIKAIRVVDCPKVNSIQNIKGCLDCAYRLTKVHTFEAIEQLDEIECRFEGWDKEKAKVR